MESVFQESPPHHGLAMVDPSQDDLLSLSLSLSSSLIKEGFSLGKLRKSSKPITAIRQATRENLGASQGLIPNCQCYVGRARLQCTKVFFIPLLKPSLSLSRSDLLRRRSENNWWTGKFLLKL
jgi:hypothetical protein